LSANDSVVACQIALIDKSLSQSFIDRVMRPLNKVHLLMWLFDDGVRRIYTAWT